ncbi:MAG: hypothetical protein HLUCCO07_15920 [Rhodobacteraceae bacterium HLUCCO07]|nr:MAG: hypothetical protein HLUCCO07_15920 [Rhodobacteraceae bacterium HLUCCO07]
MRARLLNSRTVPCGQSSKYESGKLLPCSRDGLKANHQPKKRTRLNQVAVTFIDSIQIERGELIEIDFTSLDDAQSAREFVVTDALNYTFPFNNLTC